MRTELIKLLDAVEAWEAEVGRPEGSFTETELCMVHTASSIRAQLDANEKAELKSSDELKEQRHREEAEDRVSPWLQSHGGSD